MVTRVSFLIMKIMYERKLESSKWDEGGLVPKVHKVIEKYKLRVNDNLTKPYSDETYCVRHYTCEHWTVDLNKHTW